MDDKKPQDFEEDPDAPPSDEERALSERLRDALADPRAKNDDADLARALSLGFEPREIAPDEHRAIVEAALARAVSTRARSNVRRVVFGMGAALAVAAAAILVIRNQGAPGPVRDTAATMVATRSTQPLFDEPFARAGGASARIDRIAMARASDLRENRFASWGVR